MSINQHDIDRTRSTIELLRESMRERRATGASAPEVQGWIADLDYLLTWPLPQIAVAVREADEARKASYR